MPASPAASTSPAAASPRPDQHDSTTHDHRTDPPGTESRDPMTELAIKPEEIRGAIEQYVEAYRPETTREEVGRVTEVGDGIARLEGLPSAMTNELLEFEGGVLGLALNLEEGEIGCVILGEGNEIEEGQ